MSLGFVALLACTAPRAPLRIGDPDPNSNIPAIKLAGEHKDRSQVPEIVEQLQSDDPAVRMFAIEALVRITGQDLGYVYYADLPARHAAVGRWRQWVKDHPFSGG